jgi:hypothetical protein
MAVDHVKSTFITNLDASPAVINTAGEGGPAPLKSIDGYATAVASSSVGATYQLVRIPSNAKVKNITFESEAQGAGKFDLGLFYATDGVIGKTTSRCLLRPRSMPTSSPPHRLRLRGDPDRRHERERHLHAGQACSADLAGRRPDVRSRRQLRHRGERHHHGCHHRHRQVRHPGPTRTEVSFCWLHGVDRRLRTSPPGKPASALSKTPSRWSRPASRSSTARPLPMVRCWDEYPAALSGPWLNSRRP